MKRYLPYILAAAAGLMLRAGIAGLYGIGYTMDGHDIFNAVVALLFCYWFIRAARALAKLDAEEQQDEAGRCDNAAETADNDKNAA